VIHSVVKHADDPAQHGRAAATLCRCLGQFANRAVAESQRRITHQHEVEYAEVASGCEQ
jgi:hypothetical protein